MHPGIAAPQKNSSPLARFLDVRKGTVTTCPRASRIFFGSPARPIRGNFVTGPPSDLDLFGEKPSTRRGSSSFCFPARTWWVRGLVGVSPEVGGPLGGDRAPPPHFPAGRDDRYEGVTSVRGSRELFSVWVFVTTNTKTRRSQEKHCRIWRSPLAPLKSPVYYYMLHMTPC